MSHRRRAVVYCFFAFLLGTAAATALGEEWYLADGRSWPGRVMSQSPSGTAVEFFSRGARPEDGLIPRVQSVTTLSDGRVVFCSGLDRSILTGSRRGERTLHHGGYLARQVRTDAEGRLYWSGLETPRDGQPLPDGFIYRWDPASGDFATLLTFSQGDVGHDWWGAFDVREGRVIVGTLTNRTRLYDVSVSPVRLFGTLPISATAFRFGHDGALYACDGQGTLYRFPDLRELDRSEVVLRSPVPFVDFVQR